jgi:type II secretory pathway component PulF
LDREISQWREQIEAGVRPSELLRDNRRFPAVFANLYATGEASGQLDDHLGRINTYYQESGTNTLRQVSAWTPRILYLVIAVWIGYQIVSFYAGYFRNIFELSDF